jgi:hypothetical protein
MFISSIIEDFTVYVKKATYLHIYILNTHEIFGTKIQKIQKTSECLSTNTLYNNILI